MHSDQRTRIEKLKQEIESVVGFQPVFGKAADCPPDVEEAFLQRVLSYEQKSRRPLRERLSEAGVVVEDPSHLTDDDLVRQLWQVIHALETLDIVPANTDHLSDRELYTSLWKIASSGGPGVVPDYLSRGWYIDFTASDGDIDTYLKYYATDRQRRDYRRAFPRRAVPQHCDPPYDRDRLIPDFGEPSLESPSRLTRPPD
jgi:hypothetical protein